VSVLQIWYGPDARRYDPEEVPIPTDDALRVLELAHQEGALVLDVETEEDVPAEIAKRLKSYNEEWRDRHEAERNGSAIAPYSMGAFEISALLRPKRIQRSEELGRQAQLVQIWPATATGRKALRGMSDIENLRSTIETKRGGHRKVAQLDREAEKLLSRAQRYWCATKRVSPTLIVVADWRATAEVLVKEILARRAA